MQPVRKVLSATHFKAVEVEGNVKWTPCSPGDSKAVERSWTEIESDELLEPPLKLVDFERALEATRPTVTSEDILKHQKWTDDSGKSTVVTIHPRFNLLSGADGA
jgi:vacuolar protein-sorting-associated protein 4